MKYILTSILLLIIFSGYGQNSILIFNDDFEGGSSAFTLNTSGVGSSTGTNAWIINDEYSGNGLYPNTTDQNNTSLGTISFPNGNYLHIHDLNSASTALNANYDPSVASDNFVAMNNGFCTMGFENIAFSFFYLCEGNATDYGEVYYSADGGPWTQIGNPQYSSTSLWDYDVISSPAFEDVYDLKFGFRWVNESGSQSGTMSFSIDDIFVVGDFDQVFDPVQITANTPDSVCQESILYFNYDISDTLCDGQYSIEISDGTGNFANILNTWAFNINYPNTNGFLGILIDAATIPVNNCYKIRVNRVSPPPIITGIESTCIKVVQCPNTISTEQPAVTIGSEGPNGTGVCVGSVIDVPFWSTGTFTNNTYTAELSDEFGNFSNPLLVGTSQSDETFDPSVTINPGNVSGFIPSTPPGCNYFIRVTSSSPNNIGSIWGPFCIIDCDIETNNKQDLQFCITDLVGDSALIPVNTNIPPSNVTYNPGNEFQIEVLDPMSFTSLNIGSLGSIFATGTTNMWVTAPPLPQYLALGLAPGMYYIRVIATDTDQPNNQLGTLVRMTVGAPDPNPLNIWSTDTVFCQGDILFFYIDPNNYPESEYQWYLNGSVFGPPPNNAPTYPLGVVFNGSPGIYTFNVQETNYGCTGTISPDYEVEMIDPPFVTIFGPDPVCFNDTGVYNLPFVTNTYYSWDLDCGTIIDTSNNQVTIVWNQLNSGNCDLNVFALNQCGSNTGLSTISINELPNITTSSDTIICEGEQVQISATGGSSYIWSPATGLINPSNSNTIAQPLIDTDYEIEVTNTDGCVDVDTVSITVNPLPNADAGLNTMICEGNSIMLQASGADSYLWNNDPTLSELNISNPNATPINDNTYFVTITNSSTGCSAIDSVLITVIRANNNGLQIDACEGEIVTLDANNSGATYIWNTGETTQQITVDTTGSYIVEVISPDNGCSLFDTVYVSIESCESILFIPNAFTPNSDGINDIFSPVVSGANIKLIQIFNRWGEVVFETNYLQGWNGNKKNEQPAQQAVYIWKIVYEEIYTSNILEKTGTLTLIR